jgi:hypothetical protein
MTWTGRFKIWRPQTNHGHLRTAWELGNVKLGTAVRLILIRQRGNVAPGREIAEAALVPGKWKVVKVSPDGRNALVEEA